MHADTQSELNLLREQVATLQAALLQSRRENALLRQKVDALVRRVFGASSERIEPAQLELLQLYAVPLTDTPAAQSLTVPPEPRAAQVRKESAPRLPENLPLVEQVIDPNK